VMEVIVEDKQLSLAIGKKGQNVRLAAKLTGWRIDIKSEEEKRREVEAQFEGLEATSDAAAEESAAAEETAADESAADETAGGAEEIAPADAEESAVPYSIEGVGAKTIGKLVEAGFPTVDALAAANADQLSAIPGIGEKTAEKILAAVRGEHAETE